MSGVAIIREDTGEVLTLDRATATGFSRDGSFTSDPVGTRLIQSHYIEAGTSGQVSVVVEAHEVRSIFEDLEDMRGSTLVQVARPGKPLVTDVAVASWDDSDALSSLTTVTIDFFPFRFGTTKTTQREVRPAAAVAGGLAEEKRGSTTKPEDVESDRSVLAAAVDLLTGSG